MNNLRTLRKDTQQAQASEQQNAKAAQTAHDVK
jgi:hypothetical protein